MSGRQRRVDALNKRVDRLQVPHAVAERFGRYKVDPVGFCRDVLGVQSATRRSTGAPYQFDVLADLVSELRVAVRSGHGVGKTGLDAWAALWWLCSRPMSRVVVLAPEFQRQIRAILFSETRKWARRSKVALPVEVLASRILVPPYGEEWSATGMSSGGDPARLEGFHAEGGVLLICDEMKGIPVEAFDAVQGALSGLEDARLLVTSVPGGAGAGPFWKACGDRERWRVHHLPSTDSSLVSPAWCADRAKDWGEHSPLYQSRVLGEFADAGEGVLFPLSLLEAAQLREMPEGAPGTGLGVDVARSTAGDLNAVGRVDGGRVRVVATWRSPDLMQTTAKVLHVLAETGARKLAVDVGGPGGGVADRLKELGYTVQAVHFGGAPRDARRFKNWRAEAYWNLREALEKGTAALPRDDDDLMADLAVVRYFFTADGKIQLEDKDTLREQLGRSPDRADCVVLALAVAGIVGRRPVPAVSPGGTTQRNEFADPMEPVPDDDDGERAPLWATFG